MNVFDFIRMYQLKVKDIFLKDEFSDELIDASILKIDNPIFNKTVYEIIPMLYYDDKLNMYPKIILRCGI